MNYFIGQTVSSLLKKKMTKTHHKLVHFGFSPKIWRKKRKHLREIFYSSWSYKNENLYSLDVERVICD